MKKNDLRILSREKDWLKLIKMLARILSLQISRLSSLIVSMIKTTRWSSIFDYM